MKKIITLFALIASLFGYSQNKDCLKFKDGTFKVTDPASKKTCIITRKGDVQTERMEESDETYEFELKWLDDCTYTVIPTPASAARNQALLKPGLMTVKIAKMKEGSYTQRVTVANNPKFRRLDEVFVVEDK